MLHPVKRYCSICFIQITNLQKIYYCYFLCFINLLLGIQKAKVQDKTFFIHSCSFQHM